MRRRTAATSGTSGRRAAARQPPRSTAEAIAAAAAVRIQAFYRGRLGRLLAARWRQRKQQETLEGEQRKRAERRKREAFCEMGGGVVFFFLGWGKTDVEGKNNHDTNEAYSIMVCPGMSFLSFFQGSWLGQSSPNCGSSKLK